MRNNRIVANNLVLNCERLESRLVLSNRTFVTALYQDVLLRDPSPSEAQSWVRVLNRGRISREEVASVFWGSAEHRGIQVDNLYRQILDREADPEGRATHVLRLLNGSDIRNLETDFINSVEYQQKFVTDASYVDALYADVLDRVADPQGRANNLAALESGEDRQELAQLYVYSDEALLRSIDEVYVDLLHRLADADGLQLYASVISSGVYNFDDVAVTLMASQEYELVHAQIVP